MGNKWIIDVLADLRAFADLNGLPELAGKLDEATTVAKAEIGMTLEGAPMANIGDTTLFGRFAFAARDRHSA